MPPDFGRKWGTECLNTRFPLPTLLCAGYVFFKQEYNLLIIIARSSQIFLNDSIKVEYDNINKQCKVISV